MSCFHENSSVQQTLKLRDICSPAVFTTQTYNRTGPLTADLGRKETRYNKSNLQSMYIYKQYIFGYFYHIYILIRLINNCPEDEKYMYTGIILCMRSANGRWRYIVTLSLIGWAHKQNDPCVYVYILLCCIMCFSCMMCGTFYHQKDFFSWAFYKFIHCDNHITSINIHRHKYHRAETKTRTMQKYIYQCRKCKQNYLHFEDLVDVARCQ